MDITDKKALSEHINRKQPFSVKFKYADREFLLMAGGIFSRLLTAHDQLYLLNSVISIMREIMGNAQKANAKRLYFAVKGLNISKPQDYQKGMERFRADFMYKPDEMSAYLLKSDFYVAVDFGITDDDISFAVTNNAALNKSEKERISYRIEKANAYKNVMEAYEDIQDESEGAGLGIAMILVTLKNIGIDRSLFQIKSGDHSTTVSLKIPRLIKPREITTRVREKIVRDVRDLPPFPVNVVKILELCDDPDSSLDSIAGGIMSDPAITTGVMKLSNSAAFVSGKRIESVIDAVRILGIRNVRSMVLASSARRIIEERYSEYEEIWEHSNRVAGYARSIALEHDGSLVAEKALLAGLLHDLGKIILLSADPTTAKKIAKQTRTMGLITETFMEEISIGISHSTIGGLIAEKWNFPGYLADAIRRHHDPLNAAADSGEVVHAVYLANLFCGIESGKYEYHYCYEGILEKYGLSGETAFDEMHAALKKNYES